LSGLLIYGVVRSSHRDLDAVANDEARIVRAGSLAAVVRDVADDAVLVDEDAAAYLTTLVGLLPGGPVIPVQFGTVAPDEGAVRDEVLEMERSDLEQHLAGLEGLVEVRLTVETNPEAEIDQLFQTWPDLRRTTRAHGHDGALEYRVELGKETSILLAERRDRLSERLLDRLSGHAEAHALLAAYAVTELRHAYLVRADGLAAFDDLVRTVCEEMGDGHEVEYVGPLPAFDFTDVNLTPPVQHSRWSW
jgi:hypothetical protein